MISNARQLPPPPAAGPAPDASVRYSPLQVAWRRRWTLLLTVVLCLAGAWIYILKATPVYTSTSVLYVEQSGPQILTDVPGVARQNDSFLNNQAALIKSTPILATAIESTDVVRMKTFEDVDNITTYLKKNLEVSVGKQNDLITVSFDSPYPEEAARLVNGVVEAYVSDHSRKKKSSAVEVLRILQESWQLNEKELREKMQELVAFKQSNGTLSFAGTEGKGNIILERLAKLSDALTVAQLATFEADASCHAAVEMLKTPASLSQLVEAYQRKNGSQSDKEYDALLAEMRQKQQERLSLRQRGVIRNPAMEDVEAQIRFVQSQIADREKILAESYVATLDRERQVTASQEKEIRAAFDQQKQEALELNTKAANLVRLESEVKRAEELSDSLAKRIQEVGVDATADTGALNISVHEVARPEDKPTSPNKRTALALAMVLGLMLGLGGAFARELTDHRLRTADDVGAALGLPVLGVVPQMAGKHSYTDRGQSVRLQPMSETAEAYRTIRTAVFFAASGEGTKTILVTSPAPGDGKTTSASNLAIALAQAGHRTLLLDADFRKPSQHKIFQIDDKVGLSSVIAGQVKLREAVRQTESPGLYVLPCGPIPPNPSEILNGKRFAQVMEVLCNAFDRIVLDSPPVMPVTDARILAASADLTVLVLRADKSTVRMSRHARDGLLSVGANILGVVVNGMSKRKREGYYGYGGYYGRGESTDADVLAEASVPVESNALELNAVAARRGGEE
jgi:capsular exopolysaccharide synthesis family protein